MDMNGIQKWYTMGINGYLEVLDGAGAIGGNLWIKTSGPGALEEPRKVAQLVLAPNELTQVTIDIREFAINCDKITVYCEITVSIGFVSHSNYVARMTHSLSMSQFVCGICWHFSTPFATTSCERKVSK